MNISVHTHRMKLTALCQSHMTSVTMTIEVPSASFDLRDIRTDLRTRIAAFEKLMADKQARFATKQEEAAAVHKREMDALKKAVTTYQVMLDIEDSFVEVKAQRAPGQAAPGQSEPKTLNFTMPMPASRQPLAEFFISEIGTRGPLTKEELRQAAQSAGYFGDGDGGGRATHATLVNIQRNNRVVLEDGKFAVFDSKRELEKLL